MFSWEWFEDSGSDGQAAHLCLWFRIANNWGACGKEGASCLLSIWHLQYTTKQYKYKYSPWQVMHIRRRYQQVRQSAVIRSTQPICHFTHTVFLLPDFPAQSHNIYIFTFLVSFSFRSFYLCSLFFLYFASFAPAFVLFSTCKHR
jgi:hypothetical protein